MRGKEGGGGGGGGGGWVRESERLTMLNHEAAPRIRNPQAGEHGNGDGNDTRRTAPRHFSHHDNHIDNIPT